MRDFIIGSIPVNMDTNTIYGVTKFYFNNVLNGVIPLWEPFFSLGRPFYAIAICNLFNPVVLLVPLLKLLGINYAHAFVIYMLAYFFIGCAGFYFLALELFKDRLMAYLAYVALMFSSFGASTFTQFTFLEIVVPAIWVFVFLLRFAREQNKGNFMGLTFAKMIWISSYLPFYFVTVMICFLPLAIILYLKESRSLVANIFHFICKHWRLTLLACLGILLAAAPLLAYKVLDSSGDVVAPGRHCQYSSAQECYDRTMGRQGGMSYEEITRSGSLGERVDMQYLFGHLDKITYGSDSLFFLPVFIFVLLALSLFLPLKRLTVLLSTLALLVGLIASGNASGLHQFLYHHIFIFSYFRNIFFLGSFLIPIVILLGIYQLQMLLIFTKNLSFPNVLVGNLDNSINRPPTETFGGDMGCMDSSLKKVIILGLIVIHGAMFLFLKHFEGVPMISYLSLGLSLMIFILYFSGMLKLSAKMWAGILAILLIVQPAWLLRAYAINAREFASELPSMHVTPVFNWVRPMTAAVSSARIYQFVPYEDFWYDMSMTDAPPKVGFPQSATRWTFDLSEHTAPKVLADYAQYKIIVYDELGGAGQPVTAASSEIAVKYFDVNTLRLRTDFLKDKTVVYNDSYTSSWKATVDGKPVVLIRANGAFKGVKVPAGVHEIEFSYHPPGDRWVYILATAGLLIFLAGTCVLLFRGL